MVEITGYQIQGKDGLNAFTDDQRQTFETFGEAVSFADEIWERAEQINAQTEDENRKLKKEDYRIASYKNGVLLGSFPLFTDSYGSYSEDIAVKEFRKETGMSQRQFADYFKLSVRTLQEWEQGRQKPPEYLIGLLKQIWQLNNNETKPHETKKMPPLYDTAETLADNGRAELGNIILEAGKRLKKKKTVWKKVPESMPKKEQSHNTNDALRKRFNISQETAYVLSRYRTICREIIDAYQFGMSFIPLSQWLEELDEIKFVEDRSEEFDNFVQSLKDDLKALSKALHYTQEDDKGFLITEPLPREEGMKEDSRQNRSICLREGGKINAVDRSLTTGELAEYLNQFPKETTTRLESDSYDFEPDFEITAAWQDEDNTVILYGN